MIHPMHKLESVNEKQPSGPRYLVSRANHIGLGFVLLGFASLLWAQPEPSPMQKRIEAGRLLQLPKPAGGAVETHWHDLVPPGWSAVVDSPTEGETASANGERTVAARTLSAMRIKRAWEQAPAVDLSKAPSVRLTGYAVVRRSDDEQLRQIVLAPYRGACTDHRTPPANQMVVVTLKRPLPKSMARQPVWVTGRIVDVSQSSPCGRVAYLMVDATWTPYPVNAYPLPRYSLPR